jgi:TfoX/Sxy family transcriptional regulator of competence genes
MAYDEHLADRLRELLADEEAITEKKMFGGLAFLLHGNMSVSASRNGGLLARIDPADTDSALGHPHAELMQMGGRAMDGWIRVAPEGLGTQRELTAWVRRSVTFAKTLPAKQAPRRPPGGAGRRLPTGGAEQRVARQGLVPSPTPRSRSGRCRRARSPRRRRSTGASCSPPTPRRRDSRPRQRLTFGLVNRG